MTQEKMKVIITKQWDDFKSHEFDGEKVEVVSLFECWTQAWDVSNLNDEEINEMISSDDPEQYASSNDIAVIETIYASGNNGSDNNWCEIDDQSKTKSIISDVSGIGLYEKGLYEYMEGFGERYTACQYWDGSNFQLAFEQSGDEIGSTKIEFVEG